MAHRVQRLPTRHRLVYQRGLWRRGRSRRRGLPHPHRSRRLSREHFRSVRDRTRPHLGDRSLAKNRQPRGRRDAARPREPCRRGTDRAPALRFDHRALVLDPGAGTAAGASYDIGNGFTAAVGYSGNGSSTNGLLTQEGDDEYGAQLSYAADSYGASVSYANIETVGVDTTYWALNGYFTPSEAAGFPSISVGYETDDEETAGVEDGSQYFIGLQWDEMGPGTLGVAMGTDGSFKDADPEYMVYEAFYSYPVNDGMTITPYIYLREQNAVNTDDTGIAVVTSFSF